jgi:hypothetical protein
LTEADFQHQLARGLGFLRQLVAAQTYEERHKLIGSRPEPAPHFLNDALYALADAAVDLDYAPLSEYNEQMMQERINPPIVDDPDPGPYDAWFWAHLGKSAEEFTFSFDRFPLRSQGYVMWDRLRLVHQFDIRNIAYSFAEHGCPEIQPKGTMDVEEVECSHKRRSEIWDAGGRGWWSKDNESRIVWPARDN